MKSQNPDLTPPKILTSKPKVTTLQIDPTELELDDLGLMENPDKLLDNNTDFDDMFDDLK